MTDILLRLKRKVRFAYTKSWRYLSFNDAKCCWNKRFEPLTFVNVFIDEFRGPKWIQQTWDPKKKIYHRKKSGKFNGHRPRLSSAAMLKYYWPMRKGFWNLFNKKDWRIFYRLVLESLRHSGKLYAENERLKFELRCSGEARDHWRNRYQKLWKARASELGLQKTKPRKPRNL